MEQKKKKKLIVIISIVSVLVIASVLATIFIIKGATNKNKNSNNASNVNYSTEYKLKEAEIAIARKEKSENFNGCYTYSHVGSIEYNEKLTDKQIASKIWNGLDENSFINSLNTKRRNLTTSNKEILLFSHGKFTRTYTKTKKVIETGVYYGTDFLSDILIKNKNNNNHTKKYTMSLEIPKLKQNATTEFDDKDNTQQLVIYENVYSTEDSSLILFTIGYVYNQIPDTSNIIDDNSIKFNI